MKTEDVVGVVCLVLFVSLLVFLVTADIVKDKQREFVCIELGYEGYAQSSCYKGENPMMFYPYKNVFDRVCE